VLSAHRAAGGFRGAATAKTWLYRICVRAVMLHRQRLRPRTLVLLPDVEAPSRGETPLEELLAKERALVLQEHLRALSPEQLSVWALHDIEGLTMREVAERLDCPLQTAYSRLRVARQAIELKVLELEDPC
jgi:RNA polymerase sigma-70 factor (ECF subfamily)